MGGGRHLRTLPIHGARAVVRTAKKKSDRNIQWVKDTHERCGHDKAVVAIANQKARVISAVLSSGEDYLSVA